MHKELLEVEKNHFLALKKELDPEILKKIEADFKVKYAHDAVQIEGKNTITLEEAFTLEKVCKESRISEREQKELLNHMKAYQFVKAEVEKGTLMSEEFIKDAHQILLGDIMPGGLYRQVNIGLKGYHQPPDYVKVYDRMKRMMDELDFTFKGTTIERSAFILLTLSKIHTLIDGNGRVGRLMMNYYILKDDYLPI